MRAVTNGAANNPSGQRTDGRRWQPVRRGFEVLAASAAGCAVCRALHRRQLRLTELSKRRIWTSDVGSSVGRSRVLHLLVVMRHTTGGVHSPPLYRARATASRAAAARHVFGAASDPDRHAFLTDSFKPPRIANIQSAVI